MRDVGRPWAKVKLLTQPRVRGYDQAVSAIRNRLTARYGFMDLWLFFPDADRTSRDGMRNLETHVAAEGVTLLCCIDRSLENLPLLFRLCPELRCLRDRIATLLQEPNGRADHAGV